MDFGSIVESLSNGPFIWATGPITRSCAHNCFDKNHYHRYCGCALHAIDSAFRGSPPTSEVKVSWSVSRSGRMYRSISCENMGEKKFQSGNTSNSGNEPLSPAAFSPSSFTSSVSSLPQLGMGRDDPPSFETLTLVEELARSFTLMKDEDAGGERRNSETDHYDFEIDASGWTAYEDEGLHASPTISYSSQLVGEPSRSISSKHLNGFNYRSEVRSDRASPPTVFAGEAINQASTSPSGRSENEFNWPPIVSCGR